MKNIELWKPTKFVKTDKGFRASNNIEKVGLGYRLIVDIQAAHYSKIISKHASGALLDLGCGDVSLYEMYSDLVSSIVCVDWDNTYHSVSHLDYSLNLNEPFQLEKEKFDTLLLTDVLEHIASPDNLFKEVASTLKLGGKLILTVPFLHLIHEEPYDFYRYTEFKLIDFCKKNNLEIVELYPYGGSLEVVLDIIAKHLSFSKMLSKVHYYIGGFLISSFIGEKIYKISSRKFPLGYCLVAQKIE